MSRIVPPLNFFWPALSSRGRHNLLIYWITNYTNPNRKKRNYNEMLNNSKNLLIKEFNNINQNNNINSFNKNFNNDNNNQLEDNDLNEMKFQTNLKIKNILDIQKG